MHVYKDLTPYICTFRGCKDELEMFQTRKLWADHEFTQHRTVTYWRCSECSSEISSPQNLTTHLQVDHHLAFSQLNLASVLSSSERTREIVEYEDCQLCQEHPGDSRRAFVSHMCRHMEYIALASLPRNTDSDTDQNSQVSEESDKGSDRALTASQRRETVLEEEDDIIKCFCAFQGDDGSTVLCEQCITWQHIECYYPSSDMPEVHKCVDCEPRVFDARKASERQRKKREQLTKDQEDMTKWVRKDGEHCPPEFQRDFTTSAAEKLQERFNCSHPNCAKSYARPSDLRRHDADTHSVPIFNCPVPDCSRRGSKGFGRRDKARDHIRRAHKLHSTL